MTVTKSLLRVLCLPLIALFAIACPALPQAQSPKQPNIIMILGDDPAIRP